MCGCASEQRSDRKAMLLLQSLCPITRPAFGMGNCDHLDVVETFAENDGERVSIDNGTKRAAQVRRTN